MATPAGWHQPAQPEIRRQWRVHRSPAIELSPWRCKPFGEDTARERLHDYVTQVPGQFAERGSSSLDTFVLQRSQLRQATILWRTFLPDAARLPSTPQRASTIQPGVTVAQGDPRWVEAVRASSAVSNIIATATSWTAKSEVATETRQARSIGTGARCVARPGDLTREQIKQLGFRQQEYLAAEPELKKW